MCFLCWIILMNYGWPHTFHKFCNSCITISTSYLLRLLWSMRHPPDIVRVGVAGVAQASPPNSAGSMAQHMLRCPTSHACVIWECHVTVITNGHTGTLSHCSSHCNSFKDRVPIQAPDLQMSCSDFDENNRYQKINPRINPVDGQGSFLLTWST